MMEVLLGTVAVLLLAFNTGAKTYITAWFAKVTKKLEDGPKIYKNGIEKYCEFHIGLEKIGKLKYVTRVLLFRGSNCGGVPSPGQPYIVRCFYGWAEDPTLNPEEKYNFNLKVDAYYMQMLLKVIELKVLEVTTSEMPKGSQLRYYYENERVHTARIYKLSIDKTELKYMSVASYTGGFTDEQRNEIDLTVDRVRSVLLEV